MAKKNGRKKGSLDWHAEFAALGAEFRKLAEEQADINSNFDKRQKRFEQALNTLAGLLKESGERIHELYELQEQANRRLDKLDKEMAEAAVMIKATGKQVIETNKRFDAWLKLEKQRRRNGHNGSNGKRNS